MGKFQNVKTNGYASKAESRRAHELSVAQSAGVITDLREQVRWKILPSQDGERPVHYVADFQYRDCNGQLVVEDVKGVKTPVYILKRKMMLFVHGIKILEVA